MWKEAPRTRKKEVLSSHLVKSSRLSLMTVSLDSLKVPSLLFCPVCPDPHGDPHTLPPHKLGPNLLNCISLYTIYTLIPLTKYTTNIFFYLMNIKISYTVIRRMLNAFDHFCTCVLMPYSSFSLLPALVLLDQEIT